MRYCVVALAVLAAFLAGSLITPAQIVNLPVKAKGKAEENLNNPEARERKAKEDRLRHADMPQVEIIDPVRPKLTPIQVSEPLLGAMEEEITRGMGLRMGGLEAPYFIQDTVEDNEQLSITAELGSVLGIERTHHRPLRVEVRVGSELLDNSNAAFQVSHGGGAFVDLATLPVDNDFWALRHFLWLATDQAYKGALDAMGKKKAALNATVRNEVIPDFSDVEHLKILQKTERAKVDEKEWAARIRSLSEVFLAYPRVYDSSVSLEAVQSVVHLVNSESTSIKVPENLYLVRVHATTQADDGMPLYDGTVVPRLHLAELGEADLKRSVEDVAQHLTELAKAPRGERYIGPVLFEPYAAAQVVAEVLGAHLPESRRPVTDPGRALPIPLSEFDGRIGSRVLPEWMSLVDDPQAKEWHGEPLAGGYEFDMEGVAPVPLTLVENGILKTYLMTRMPVRGLETSNGRARLPGPFFTYLARISNLMVKTSRAEPLTAVKQKLIEAVKQQGKPYGIIVRKTDYPSAGSYAEVERQMVLAARTSAGRPVSTPLLVYRVYPDGREELVRGLRFHSLTARTFRDILSASSEQAVFSFLDTGAPLGFPGGSNYLVPCSVVSPGLLFEEIELESGEEERPMLPLVTPPPVLSLTGPGAEKARTPLPNGRGSGPR